MTITVVGHGYVGLVSACVFADFGNKVWVVGHTPEKLQRLKNGDPIIYEPGLAEMLKTLRPDASISLTPSIRQLRNQLLFLLPSEHHLKRTGALIYLRYIR